MSNGVGRKLLYFVAEDWYFVSHRLSVAIAAKKAGYDVVVVTRVREHDGPIRAAGLRIIPFEIARSGLNPFVELRTVVRLIRLFRSERPVIVHLVALKPVLYGCIAARVNRVTHVVSAFGGMGWLFSSDRRSARLLKPIVRRAIGWLLKAGLALVQNVDDALLLQKLGVPSSRIRRISGAGVDLARFAPTPEPSGTPMVLFVGRLIWDKGIGEFVAAAKAAKQAGVVARFVVAGAPDAANPSSVTAGQIRKWVEEGSIEDLGWVSDMPALLAQSAIVCLPSYYGEGIPKSLIEGAAAGRPLITCDMPGCREIVRHEENGLLVAPRDANALRRAIESLLNDRNLRRRMGLQSRQRAEREYGLDAIVEQTLSLYAECPDSRSSR